MIWLSFEIPLLDVALQKGCASLSSHSSKQIARSTKTALKFNPACSILKLFTSTLDSQVFLASLSTLWISRAAVQGSPHTAASLAHCSLHAEFSCLHCRWVATWEHLGHYCVCVMCSYTQFQIHFFNYPFMERGGYPAIFAHLENRVDNKSCAGCKAKVSHPAWGEGKGIN